MPLKTHFGKYKKATLAKSSNLRKFFNHCCHARHYTFSVLKCGDSLCALCQPIKLTPDVFNTLKHLPDPTMQDDGHYRHFKELDVTCKTLELKMCLYVI